MGNSSSTSLPTYSCNDNNLSRTSVTPEYWEINSISDDYGNNSTAIAVIMSIFLLIGLPANTIIIISIIYQRLYKETTHILLLNLAISDFLVCFLVMPPIIVVGFAGEYIFGSSDYIRCQVCKTGLLFTALTVLSVNIVGLISIDRFIFIKFPLRYNKYVTTNRVIAVLIMAWVLSFFEAILPLFGFGEIMFAPPNSACLISFVGESKLIGLNIYYAVLLIGLSLIPLTAIVVVNILIVCIAKEQISKVYRTRRSFRNVADLRTFNNNLRKEMHKRKNKKQLVLIRAFGAILIANFIVWTPLVIITVLFLVLDDDVRVPLGFLTFSYFCLMIHSILHPLIEGCFIPEIKMTFKKALGLTLYQKYIRKRRASSATTTRTEETAGTQSIDLSEDIDTDMGPDTPTGSCCLDCSLALLPVTET